MGGIEAEAPWKGNAALPPPLLSRDYYAVERAMTIWSKIGAVRIKLPISIYDKLVFVPALGKFESYLIDPGILFL